MKTKRIESALLVYSSLIAGKGKIDREEIMSSMNISSATFKRVISDVRCYLMEHEPDKELEYCRKDGFYQLHKVNLE